MPAREVTGDHLERYLAVAPISLALERSIECRLLSEVPLREPLLDLGCGDGLFASVFFGGPVAIGVDRDVRALRRARPHYRSVVAAEAAALPFRDMAFETVLANSVLEHVAGLDAILVEVRRTLRTRGRFVLTVPTPSYQRLLLYSRLARAAGLRALAERYERLINHVFEHREIHDAQGWRTRLQHAGLVVIHSQGYLSATTISLDDLFYASAAVSRLWERLLGHYFLMPSLRRRTAPLLAALLRPLYRSPASDDGYVLLVAERPF